MEDTIALVSLLTLSGIVEKGISRNWWLNRYNLMLSYHFVPSTSSFNTNPKLPVYDAGFLK